MSGSLGPTADRLCKLPNHTFRPGHAQARADDEQQIRAAAPLRAKQVLADDATDVLAFPVLLVVEDDAGPQPADRARPLPILPARCVDRLAFRALWGLARDQRGEVVVEREGVVAYLAVHRLERPVERDAPRRFGRGRGVPRGVRGR